MKKSAILLVFILGFGSIAMSQIVVKVRPAKPKVVVVKPNRSKPNHAWVDGHWKWNANQNRYVWKKGHWVKKRRGHVFVAGRWKATPKGHIWVVGGWKRR
ncbi:MAG: hypothetical protein ACI9FU_000464 [Granulosicoccus sp.]|jgi:hypothetical protein